MIATRYLLELNETSIFTGVLRRESDGSRWSRKRMLRNSTALESTLHGERWRDVRQLTE